MQAVPKDDFLDIIDEQNWPKVCARNPSGSGSCWYAKQLYVSKFHNSVSDTFNFNFGKDSKG